MVRCQVCYYRCLGFSPPTLGNSFISLSDYICMQRLNVLLPLRRVNALLLIFEMRFFLKKEYYFDRICLNCRFITLSVAPPVLLRGGEIVAAGRTFISFAFYTSSSSLFIKKKEAIYFKRDLLWRGNVFNSLKNIVQRRTVSI